MKNIEYDDGGCRSQIISRARPESNRRPLTLRWDEYLLPASAEVIIA